MAKSYYEFFCPVKIVAGHKALEHIPFELSTLQAKRPMIITDKGVRAVGLLEHVTAAFEGAESQVVAIFDDVPPDSSLHTVRNAAATTQVQRMRRSLRCRPRSDKRHPLPG